MKIENCARLAGKVAVITGAAQGLGQALAIRLSEEGAKVVVGDVNLDGAKETAALLQDGMAVSVDVTDYASCEALMKAAVDAYGKIDILVSNAAILMICRGRASRWI